MIYDPMATKAYLDALELDDPMEDTRERGSDEDVRAREVLVDHALERLRARGGFSYR